MINDKTLKQYFVKERTNNNHSSSPSNTYNANMMGIIFGLLYTTVNATL